MARLPRILRPASGAGRRSAGVGLLAASFLVCAAVARGETFVLQERSQPELRGKVLAEFEDLLFVSLDGLPPCFMYRAELLAIVDSSGTRHEDPDPGFFAPLAGARPEAAITHTQGEVWLVAANRPDEAQLLPPSAGVSFVAAGEALRTGETGLARLALPSRASAKLGVESELTVLHGGGRERLVLGRGEALLETHLRPVDVELYPAAALVAGPGAQVSWRREGPITLLEQHGGQSEVVWPTLRVQLGPGLAAELVEVESGWRLTASLTNPDPLPLNTADARVELAPGESRMIESEGTAPRADVWRLLRAKGELLVRRGTGGRFGPAKAGDLTLGPGDGLRTASEGMATLMRVDGATLTLPAASWLEVGPKALTLAKGRLTIEALAAPVRLTTPGGEAALRLTVIELERPGQDELLRARVAGGVAQLPLLSGAIAELERGCVARVSRGAEEARLAVERGAAQVLSRATTDRPDPRLRVNLVAGEELGVRAGEPSAPLEVLLPGERSLWFDGAGVDVALRLTPEPLCRFESGTTLRLKPGLRLGLGRLRGLPQLLFRSGPRLLVRGVFALFVENPTVVLTGPDGPRATIELEGELSAVLSEGAGPHAAAALDPREEDRLEVPPGGRVRLDRGLELTRFSLDDGRRLWIQDGAPAVQARFADARRQLFLSMPATPPLGLAPAPPLTVMATRQGEFVILDEGLAKRDQLEGLELLAGPPNAVIELIGRDRILDLLDVPPPDSPSGP